MGTDRQAVRFFYVAKGSSAEVLTQAIISYEIGYLDEKEFRTIQEKCKAISSMLTGLIKAQSQQ